MFALDVVYSETDVGLVYWGVVGFLWGERFFTLLLPWSAGMRRFHFLWGTAHVREKWID